MLSNRSTISAISAAGLALAWSWSAAAADMGTYTLAGADADGAAGTGSFYANGDAGVAILQNIVSQGSVAQFDIGPKVDVSVGYNVTPCFAVEVQSGFAYNSFSKSDGQSLSSGESAEIWSVPVMANGIFTHSFNEHWQAYGGLGAGVLISTLDENTIFGNISTTDCEFGYQAMFGIKYLFNDQMSCGLGYDFLGSLDHHWNAFGQGVTTTPTYMHSILLSLTYTF